MAHFSRLIRSSWDGSFTIKQAGLAGGGSCFVFFSLRPAPIRPEKYMSKTGEKKTSRRAGGETV